MLKLKTVSIYCLYPLNLMRWRFWNGHLKRGRRSCFIQVTCEKERRLQLIIPAWFKKIWPTILDYTSEWGCGQHVPTWTLPLLQRRYLCFDSVRQVKHMAGCDIIRSCSGGWWVEKGFSGHWTIIKEAAKELKRQASISGIASCAGNRDPFWIHNVWTFEAFWNVRGRTGWFPGICLDTMNLLTMLEDG